MRQLNEVDIRKLRGRCGHPCTTKVGYFARGWLVTYPAIGRQMVVLYDTDPCRIVTSPIRRVLTDERGVLYVETENSVYRLMSSADQGRPAGGIDHESARQRKHGF